MKESTKPNHNGPSDRSSVEQWVDAHGDALFRYAKARVRDQHAAEDLVQDTFVAAIQGKRAFRGDSNELTWLIGILRHKALDHLRKQGRETPASEADDATVAGLFDGRGMWRKRPGTWHVDTGSLAERDEFWQAFEHCIGGLPDRQAQAFSLKVLDETDTEDVCKVLDINSTNLWVILHRARTRLRECLEKTWFQTDRRENSSP